MREKKVEIDGPMLCAQALSFATTFKISDFKGSTGWLHRFRERYGIVHRSVCGEAKDGVGGNLEGGAIEGSGERLCSRQRF